VGRRRPMERSRKVQDIPDSDSDTPPDLDPTPSHADLELASRGRPATVGLDFSRALADSALAGIGCPGHMTATLGICRTCSKVARAMRGLYPSAHRDLQASTSLQLKRRRLERWASG
jgi:hypothetical protein